MWLFLYFSASPAAFLVGDKYAETRDYFAVCSEPFLNIDKLFWSKDGKSVAS